MVDLDGERDVPERQVAAMGDAVRHRGPDESGHLVRPGLGLASRRLAIIDIEHGQQPLANPDKSVVVVYNGELFDYPEKRAELETRGHRFQTDCDTELLVHLWAQHGRGMLDHLRGQFAFALVDFKQRLLLLARDRTGICPLYWTRRDGWLLFGSEIKALLASGLVRPELDPLALDHIFSFFAIGRRRTFFAGVSALLPGTFLEANLATGEVREDRYWDLDFPDRGQEEHPTDVVQQFGHTLEEAVRLRLRADVPVVSYLSGGVDSTTVAALASRVLERPIPTFTIKIPHPELDETDRAGLAGRSIGSEPTEVVCGNEVIAEGYRNLILASESPVIDTSCAAIYKLASTVREHGYKVTLSGEGSDEALAGYPWFKFSRLTAPVDRTPLAHWAGRRILRRGAPDIAPQVFQERFELMGGDHATSRLYAGCAMAGYFVYSPEFKRLQNGHTAAHDLDLPLDRMQRWHPLNRALYLGYKVMLAGLLMTHKGDRPAMANSVEARFPFLDRKVVELCARLDPELKLRGLRRDKDVLRRYAAGLLPETIANRPKRPFVARFAETFLAPAPSWVDQLLSPESLSATGYFDLGRVALCRSYIEASPPRWYPRRMLREVALVGVIATQLWHHLFLGGGLCDLPAWEARPCQGRRP